MCFSAPVSFVASGVLGVTGVASLTKVKSRREVPLAMIPLLFAIQQLMEGFIWLGVGQAAINQIFVYGFLLFAYLVWPFFIPLAMLLVEPDARRKSIMKFIFAMGVLVSIYLFIITIFFHEVGVQIVGCNIGHPYTLDRWYTLQLPFYVAAVGVAPFLSSHKILRIFGATVIISCIVTLIVVLTTFTSVWCFASAIMSVIIYAFFRKNLGTV